MKKLKEKIREIQDNFLLWAFATALKIRSIITGGFNK